MAVEEVGGFSAVKCVDDFPQGCGFDLVFELVEEHGDELLDVLLDHDID